jgi:hypothetical protein
VRGVTLAADNLLGIQKKKPGRTISPLPPSSARRPRS